MEFNLEYWLRPADKIFNDLQKHVIDGDQPLLRRVFIDRGAKILFVAHLDTVLSPRFKRIQGQRLFATGLDDRLGCAIAYQLSAELGVDLLLTDLEETGRTTGQYHDCARYHWIAEFDRAGKDIVTYDLDSADFRDALGKYWKVNFGLYSDIASMKTDVCCMNLGIGYQNAHGEDSYVDLSITRKQIKKFRRFYAQHHDTRFELDRSTFTDFDDWYFDDDDKTWSECAGCGGMTPDYLLEEVETWGGLCPDCFDVYADCILEEEVV